MRKSKAFVGITLAICILAISTSCLGCEPTPSTPSVPPAISNLVDSASGFIYTISGKDVTITGYNGFNVPPDVVLPEIVNGKTVTSIGASTL
jgi:hypothetical protein